MDIRIRCNGEYSYRIVNPMVFYTNVCGNVKNVYTRDEIDSMLKTEILTAIQPAFARISEMGIRYSALPGHALELTEAMDEALSKKWGELRGLEVFSFGINSVNANPEDEQDIKDLQKAAVSRDPSMGAARLVDAQADAMKDAAKNSAGAMTGFMGFGMAQNSGNNSPAADLYAMAQQNAQKQGAAVPADGWTCECGTVNTGKFCNECGKPKPKKWVCACGAENTGKFCTACGKPRPEKWTCECGAELSRTPGKVIEIDPDNHSLTYVPAQAAADCTVTGTVEHWNCALCGKDFADAEGTTQITDLSDGVYGAHDYNIAGASFAWVENGEGGWDYVATIPCANDGSHPATTVNATVTSSTATADCTTPNDTTYIATGFPAESGLALPADYADKVISGAIDENAHDWAAPVFTWADDLSSATATRTCINNAEHTEDADSVSVTSEVTTPATDVEPGEITYTATALFGEESFTDTRTKTIDPSETDYEFVEFEWADDNTAKVVVKDRNNGNVTVKFAVTVNSRSVDATCLSDAYTVYTVTYEDHTDTRTVYDEGTQLEHNFTVLQSDASGHWYKCETCSETTAKEDHTGGTATCSAKAVCEVCGTAYGSFASHDFSVVQSDASGHWFKCTNCDETTVKEAHTGGTATCLAKAQCEVCGTEYGRKVQHSFTNYVYDNNATCLTNGTETAVCDHGCGTTDTRTKVASATGHNFGEWTVTTPATCRAEGVETRVCQNDPSHTQIRAIPKTDHVDADGDTLCDVCGGPTADHQHSDVDGDGYCDTCNAKTDVHQHKDANGDNICDDCGKAIDTGFRCSFCNKNDKMQASNSSVAVKLVYRIIHFIIHMVQGIRFSV